MFAHSGHVMTLANSIIGVGILAMPFCFQKCGIILAILLLIVSNWITRICCHYLIKCSLLTRRKSFEFLGFHAFGTSGKLLVELCIIGYLLGTCVTYFVVVGDLGPQIVTKMLSLDSPHVHLRTLIMVAVTVVCILPLGMLKNVDSLSTVCTASIGFYVCLVIKIVLESEEHIMSNDWTEQVKYWEPSGVLQCLPIFSMALSCQMQLFEVFESINNQSLEKLNGIVKNATWICTCVYVAVGFFGYVAFCTQSFSGNILINLSESFGSDVIKIGFVLSVAFSFPLVIFPCRASIYSLLYRKGHTDATGYIPETRFKAITIFIVCLALCFALMIPSVELIIGLVGSTIGVAICIMFPASCYRKIVKKESTERTLAQFILLSGFCLMILGTYANLNAIDAKNSGAHLEVPASINEIFVRPTALPVIKVEPLINEFEINNLSQADEKMFKLAESVEKHVKPSNEMKKDKPEIVQKPKAIEKLPPSPPPLPVDEKHEDDLKPEPSPPPVEHPPKPEKVEVVPLKANRTHSSDTAKNNTNVKVLTTTQGINKDAISKDEEMAAEELKNNKKGKQAEDELEKTQNELKKTKELLKHAVGELKEELAKQNQQTQNLVAEKFSAVVEKVEKIEREVLQKKEEQIQINEAAPVENINKNNNNEKIKKAKPDPMRRNKGSLISMLAEETTQENPSKDVYVNKEKVFEPLSYKTGELIENVKNATKLEQRLPMPLPMLINVSSANVKTDNENFNAQIPAVQQKKESEKSLKYESEHFPKEPSAKDRSEQQPKINFNALNSNNKKEILQTGVKTEDEAKPVIQLNKENEEDKQNVEAIRRDLLQVKPMQHEDSITTIKVTEQIQQRERIKRSSQLEINHPSSNGIDAELEQQNCLSAKNVETLLALGSEIVSDIKIGRKLKAI